MSNPGTDSEWESFAQEDPYWAVLTQDRFKKENLSAEARAEFFASGERYVEWVVSAIRRSVSADFAPERSLDFGCGVGRLLLPLARRFREVTGIDVSDRMLSEARAVCQSNGLTNVTLIKGDDGLTGVPGRFDFINSFIVLQHIPCERGMSLIHRLVDLLNDGGVGALHVTYSKAGLATAAQTVSWPAPDRLRDHVQGVIRAVRRRLRGGAVKQNAGSSGPVMQMNTYALNAVLTALQDQGVRNVHCMLSDHSGTYGALLLFQKNSEGRYAAPWLKE